MQQTCAHCKWWAVGKGRYGTADGQCRVNAPVMKRLVDDPQTLMDDRGYWPVTGKEDFCAEFYKRKE